MTNVTTKPDSLQLEAETAFHLFDDWFDPIETEVRGRGARRSRSRLIATPRWKVRESALWICRRSCLRTGFVQDADDTI
jgi:hypothetical protein